MIVFSKKYCPIYVYDCVVSQTASDFISYEGDLAQPCRKFAGRLSKLFEEVSLGELVRASELIVQFFWLRKKLTKPQLICSPISHTIVSILPAKKRVKTLVVFLARNYLTASENITAMKLAKTLRRITIKLGWKLRSLAARVGVYQHKLNFLICTTFQ